MCASPSVCLSIYFGQTHRLNLGMFAVTDSFALTLSCIIPYKLFVSLTVRPGGAYVLRPDTFLVFFLFNILYSFSFNFELFCLSPSICKQALCPSVVIYADQSLIVLNSSDVFRGLVRPDCYRRGGPAQTEFRT